MSMFSISNSDLEILNALTIAENIRKDLISNSCFESSNSTNVSYGSEVFKRTPSATFSTNDSAICSTYDSVISSTNEGSTNIEETSSTNADATSSTNIGATCSSYFDAIYSSTDVVTSSTNDGVISTNDGVTSSTNDSVQSIFSRANQVLTSFQLDSGYLAVIQDIQTVCLMNDLTIETREALDKKRAITASTSLAPTVLRKRLENINLVIKHLLTIASQVSKVKQSLQDAPYKTTLKVEPSCQEDVVKFFNTADAIIKKLHEDTFVAELQNKNILQVIPVDEMALHSKLQAILTGLARRLDILTEFRNCLLTTETS